MIVLKRIFHSIVLVFLLTTPSLFGMDGSAGCMSAGASTAGGVVYLDQACIDCFCRYDFDTALTLICESGLSVSSPVREYFLEEIVPFVEAVGLDAGPSYGILKRSFDCLDAVEKDILTELFSTGRKRVFGVF